MILPVILFCGETWSLTSSEKHRLEMFENRVLRRIFKSEKGEVTEGCRKMHNEERHNLYSSPRIIRTIKSKRMRSEVYAVRIESGWLTLQFILDRYDGVV
jgi:hypothetical protein